MWNPQDYANHSAAQLQWAAELRSRLSLQGHEALLDVGCGDGKITADLARQVPQGRVVGLDSSAEMVAYAAATFPAAGYPNLAFVCRDARQLAFEQAFDLIFSNAALHWVDDHLAVLQGAAAALKPGGRLVISCGGRGNAKTILQAVFEVARQPPWQPYFQPLSNPYYFYGPADYRRWLGQVGLQIERLELVPKVMLHAGLDGLASWLRTTWMPFTERVPAAEREQFIGAVVNTYIAQAPPDSEGLVQVPMVRLEVEARKP